MNSVVPDRIELIRVLYLTDQTCISAQKRVNCGQLYQRRQKDLEEQVILTSLDQLTLSYHTFSAERRMFQCCDHVYMIQNVVIQ